MEESKEKKGMADDLSVMRQIHPCNCKEYNGGQCYNCLNGAHKYCPSCSKTENDKSIGITIVTK